MVNVQIPKELNAGHEQAADRAGRTKEDLLHEVLEGIRIYLESVPQEPAERIGRSIQQALRAIAQNPYLGIRNVPLTKILGQR